MLQSFLKRTGTVVGAIFLLLITAVTGLLAWWSYGQYKDQRQYEQISTEGQRVTVKIERASLENRSWTDQLFNTVYITFTYQQQSYTLRYKQDSNWINEGDRVELFYHAGIDAFRQPRPHAAFKGNGNYSRLIRFTIVSAWNDGRKWLALTIVLTCTFVLLLSSWLASITGSAVIRKAGGIVFLGMLLTVAVYLAWNTWEYYRYYNQLKSGAQEETVQVVNTNRRSTSRRSNWFYTYEATVQQGPGERVIPIAEADYNTLKPGAPLQVYYNRRLNDMMSVNNKPSPTNLIAALFIWIILLFFARWQWLKK